MQAANW